MKSEFAAMHEQPQKTSLELLRDTGVNEEMLVRLGELFAKCPSLPEQPFEAAKHVRAYLIESGFTYQADTFLVQDMLSKKGGNCLGLTVLIASLLQERGFKPEYEVILNPHDAIYEQDLKLLSDLVQGDYFSHDDTPLPEEVSDFRDYRFTPLEHPDMVLAGKRFETTSLDPEAGPSSDWAPKGAERVVAITYPELLSNLYVDRARHMLEEGADPESIKEQYARGLALWPKNREGWSSMKDIAERTFDDEAWNRATKSYVAIGGEDSRYHFTMYEWTGKSEHLDAALKAYPAHMQAFLEKHVAQSNNARDAKFYFSVVAYCVANSSEQNIHLLYLNYARQLTEWYGKPFVDTLFKKMKMKQHQPVASALVGYRVLGDKKPLEKLLKDGWWPALPREQLEICCLLQGKNAKCDKELAALKEQYQSSRLFQRSVEAFSR